MQTIAAYLGAAIAEIAGCFAFWAWLRLGKSAWWVVPGMASLALFAWLLTLVDALPRAGPTRPMAASTSPPRWPGSGRSRGSGPTAGT